MSGNSKAPPHNPAAAPAQQRGLPGGAGRIAALATLTLREAIRSRVLLGMTTLMCLFAVGSLMWPAQSDGERVILVQRFCYGGLTFLGIISATFLAGTSLPREISTKRIYSIATKPVSRFELLTGKTCGLIAVMFIFMVLGAIITSVVTHIANTRRTYAGESYTLEVSAAASKIERDDGSTVAVTRGEILAATGETNDHYSVEIASRYKSIEGLVPKSDVTLRVRDLTLHRVAGPTALSVTAAGRAAFEHNELVLRCNTLAKGRKWNFRLRGGLPADSEKDVHVRMRFNSLLYEGGRNKNTHELPNVELLFRKPGTDEEITRKIKFTFPGKELRPVRQRGQKRAYYERVFLLPRALLTKKSLEVTVVDHSPEYPKAGRLFYDAHHKPTWHIRGFDTGDLPAGQQTLRLTFGVVYTRGYEIVDSVEVAATVTNPATGVFKTFPLQLRSETTSLLHFPRHLIDDDGAVDVTLTGISPSHRLGHQAREAPIYLMLTPGQFWASTVRSAFLIFLSLALITVLAVAASTFLSAPVAILLTLVVALSGKVKDMMLVGPEGLSQLPPTALSVPLRIPLLLIGILPLVLAVWVLARRLTVRLALTALLVAALAWLVSSSSVTGPTGLILAIPFTILAWGIAPRTSGRTALGGSVLVMTAAFLAASLAQFVSLSTKTSTSLQEGVGEWIKYVLSKVAIAFAPGFEEFSSSHYILRSLSVPWSAVIHGTAYALAYMAVCFGLGYVLFQRRGFE